ncbi:MAG: CDP-diacylglycerol--glycerol-3-phosphate 3-phosphatidyltransferase [Clostridiales bacterium]|jgi:CDP-diacylglycerol--glycerol-3-phosphate 3-phosphatidyltransferase|nr:CDP-diacylglycerol--glycerol-3-phosphate 3-phosphatidyltransferase [Clostridiales bacterium]
MNLPTKLTFLRIILVPVFVMFFLTDSIPQNRTICLTVFILAAVTDWLDGMIARKYSLVTDLGKFLDPIADKILVNSAAILFVYDVYHHSQQFVQLSMLLIAIIFVSREMVIGGFRLIAVSKSVVLAADFYGKLKTIVQMMGIVIVLIARLVKDESSKYILFTGLALLFLAALLSIMSCANYIIKNREVLN